MTYLLLFTDCNDLKRYRFIEAPLRQPIEDFFKEFRNNPVKKMKVVFKTNDLMVSQEEMEEARTELEQQWAREDADREIAERVLKEQKEYNRLHKIYGPKEQL